MKDEIKHGFDAVIAKAAAREAESKETRKQQVSERERFELAYRRALENVIMPALQEIARDVLEPAGWTCHVSRIEFDLQATLEVYRGDMKGVAGLGRPHIMFTQDRHEPKMHVMTSTQYQGGPEASYGAEEITTDLVQRHALMFFQRLAHER
jgi:hypothetical protein